ncbi:IS701 family transposase [Streptomyces microflavus]|uniref:IS701 family transposase n=1 Tax=Streptomyces microflavus TaxID=1919 RepID=UPI0036588F73
MGDRSLAHERPAFGVHSVSGFCDDVFGYLPRVDQRRWADIYVRGLLSTPGRKTVRHMARTLALPASASQALQHFVTASPWNWEAAQRELVRLAASSLSDPVWTSGTVLLEKRGSDSVGVGPHKDPSGRLVNCQVAIGLFLADDRASLPVSWRLLMDDAWCGDPERRRRARVPDSVTPLPAWALALDMVGQVAGPHAPGSAPMVFGLTAARDTARLARQPALRRRGFIIEVSSDQPLVAVSGPGGPPPGPEVTVTASEAARRAGLQHRMGGNRPLSVFVRLAPESGGSAGRQVLRLIAEPSVAEAGHRRFWITSLRDAGAETVRRLARRSVSTDATLRYMKSDLGLLDFEGRSFPGWHHHMTLASAAFHRRRPSRRSGPCVEALSA